MGRRFQVDFELAVWLADEGLRDAAQWASRRVRVPRYFFSNLSTDIRDIFCEHDDLLGLRWTQSNPRNISVAHRKSVALLDEFIGPKT